MTKFAYIAVDTAGETISGVERAPTVGRVREQLSVRDLHPVRIRERPGLLHIEITKKKLPRKQLMHFSRQLAVFVRAGIPIVEGLEVIGDEASHRVLRRVVAEMADALRSGQTFADAAAAHPEAFPPFYLSVLRSAELTGRLDLVLDQLSEYIERDLDARQKVIGALIYPAIVLFLALAVAVVMTTFVLPRFETFFESLDAKLPLPTRMLIAVAGFSGDWGWLVGVMIVGLIVGTLVALTTRRGRDRFDHVLLRLPVLGDLVRHAILERFCRILSSMVAAGVPLPDAMAVTGEATSNAVYRDGISSAREAMLRGEGLARPLAATELFPGAARQMFRVGEDTGTLDDQLHTAAVYFDRELEFKIKRFTSLFEPAVIIAMGLIVGFVALAMVSAMYGIFDQVDVS